MLNGNEAPSTVYFYEWVYRSGNVGGNELRAGGW